MSTPFSFPDWVPWWAQLLLLIVAIMLGLAFALMPFSVFGVKSRLDTLEARLDEIQGEIRSLSLRLPEPTRRAAYDDEPAIAPAPRTAATPRPPIPPAAWTPDGPRRPIGTPPPRMEPRIDRGR
jgi:hypothetical protein